MYGNRRDTLVIVIIKTLNECKEMHAQCCTHVDQTRVISLPQVVKHGGLIQVGQTGHVLCLLKLWGIHLLRDIDIKHSLLKKTKLSQYMHVSYICACKLHSHFHWATPQSLCHPWCSALEPEQTPARRQAPKAISWSRRLPLSHPCWARHADTPQGRHSSRLPAVAIWLTGFDTHAQADSAVWLRLMRSASLTAATWTAGQQFPNSKSTFFFGALHCECRRGMWASEAALRKYFANLWP